MDQFQKFVAAAAREDARQRAEAADLVTPLFEQMFADHNAQSLRTAFPDNSGVEADRARSDADRARHNELEARRMLSGDLTEAEEAERLDLASRREEIGGGYYNPRTV